MSLRLDRVPELERATGMAWKCLPKTGPQSVRSISAAAATAAPAGVAFLGRCNNI